MSTYIMRWNPEISSTKIEEVNAAREKFPLGFRGNWSIYEWEEADMGDRYVMVRVGNGACGVVFHGRFLSEPYEGNDWAGSNRKRHYVDISIEDCCDPDLPDITTEKLEAVLPEINWRSGHSGELMTEEQEERFLKAFHLELD